MDGSPPLTKPTQTLALPSDRLAGASVGGTTSLGGRSYCKPVGCINSNDFSSSSHAPWRWGGVWSMYSRRMGQGCWRGSRLRRTAVGLRCHHGHHRWCYRVGLLAPLLQTTWFAHKQLHTFNTRGGTQELHTFILISLTVLVPTSIIVLWLLDIFHSNQFNYF